MKKILFLTVWLSFHQFVYAAFTEDTPKDNKSSQTNYQIVENRIVMEDGSLEIRLNPSTLETTARNLDRPDELFSISQPVFNQKDFRIDEKEHSVRYPNVGLQVHFRLQKGVLVMEARSDKPQTFPWPMIPMSKENTVLIWPNHEGHYIPLRDTIWSRFLTSREWNTLEGLYTPFWGIETKETLITYIVENPFHNQITFTDDERTILLKFEHTFPDNRDLTEPVSFRIQFDRNVSPITPAKHFRDYLLERDGLVPLQEKIKKVPRLSRLIGTPHAYLWGGAPLTVPDVRPDGWSRMAKAILNQSKSGKPTTGDQIKQIVTDDDWSTIETVSENEKPYLHLQTEFTKVLSKVLLSPHFYDDRVWPLETLPEALRLITKKQEPTRADLLALNSHLLYVCFSDSLNDPSTWGDGISTHLIDVLLESGLDRFMLCLDGWEQIDIRPNVARYAEEKGFLLGTYDSYHSIHDPALVGTDKTWSTAQFDRELYETGGIKRPNGKPYSGFNKVGYQLSPIAAWPYVKRRVTENFTQVPYSYYFIDCDAFGEFYDDYDPGRKVTQREEAWARVDRIGWIYDTFKVPVGSEGGNYLFAKVLSVAEGVFLPVMGWGDPDMRNQDSKYFIGRYYPDIEPEIYFKQVPLKDEYIYLNVDPRFRLPLYETVFHDSIITSAHWSASHLKFTNIIKTASLTEILYQVAPLYHLTLNRFQKVKDQIVEHAKVFEKTHSYSYRYPLGEFEFLTEERDVQRTQYGGMELIANFRETAFQHNGKTIPPQSVSVVCSETGESFIYNP